MQEMSCQAQISLTTKPYLGGFAQDAVHCAEGHLSNDKGDSYKKYFADLDWADRVYAGATLVGGTYTVYWESEFPTPRRVLAFTQPITFYLGIGVVACPASIFTSRAPMNRRDFSVWISETIVSGTSSGLGSYPANHLISGYLGSGMPCRYLFF